MFRNKRNRDQAAQPRINLELRPGPRHEATEGTVGANAAPPNAGSSPASPATMVGDSTNNRLSPAEDPQYEQWLRRTESHINTVLHDPNFQAADTKLSKQRRHEMGAAPDMKWFKIVRYHKNPNMSQHCSGLVLYFTLNRDLAILFFLLGVLKLPQVVFTGFGNMLRLSGINLTLLGNLGTDVEGGTSDPVSSAQWIRERTLMIGERGFRVGTLVLWFGVIDLICTLLVMGFVVYFIRFKTPSIKRKNDELLHSLADHSIVVSRLPKNLEQDHHQYKKLLRQHFEKVCRQNPDHGSLWKDDEEFDPIAEIVLVRDSARDVAEMLELGKTKHELALLEARRLRGDKIKQKEVDKLTTKLDELTAALMSVGIQHPRELPVSLAFISFKFASDKEFVVKKYASSHMRLLEVSQPANLRFGGASMAVETAPEPEDIIWEHVAFSARKRLRNICIIWLILVGILCLAFFVTAIITRLGEADTPTPSNRGTNWQFQKDLSSKQAWAICDVHFYGDVACSSEIVPTEIVSTIDDEENTMELTTADDAELGCSTQIWQSVEDTSIAGLEAKFLSPQEVICVSFKQHTWDREGILPFNEPVGHTGRRRLRERWTGVRRANTSLFADPAKALHAHEEIWTTSSSHREGSQVNQSQPQEGAALLSLLPSLGTISEDTLSLLACDELPLPDGNSTSLCTVARVSAASPQADFVNVWRPTRWNQMTTSYCEDVHANMDWNDIGDSLLQNGTSLPNGDWYVSCYCLDVLHFTRVGPCAPYYYELLKQNVASWGILIVVAIFNGLMKGLIQWCVWHWERPWTYTQKMTFSFSKVFVAHYLNTGFNILLSTGSIFPNPIMVASEKISGSYGDLSGGWYEAAGVQLMTFGWLHTFLPHVLVVITPFFGKLVRCFRKRSQKTQLQRDMLYAKKDFEIDTALASSTALACFMLTYSGPMPLLPFCGCLAMTVIYWKDKFQLLYMSRRPPQYTTMLTNVATAMLQVGLIARALISMSAFGHPLVSPSCSLGAGSDAFLDMIINTAEQENAELSYLYVPPDSSALDPDWFGARLRSYFLSCASFPSTLFFFVWILGLLAVFGVVCFFTFTPSRQVGKLARVVMGWVMSMESSALEEGTYDECIKGLEERGYVSSYKMCANPGYRLVQLAQAELRKQFLVSRLGPSALGSINDRKSKGSSSADPVLIKVSIDGKEREVDAFEFANGFLDETSSSSEDTQLDPEENSEEKQARKRQRRRRHRAKQQQDRVDQTTQDPQDPQTQAGLTWLPNFRNMARDRQAHNTPRGSPSVDKDQEKLLGSDRQGTPDPENAQ